QEVDRAAGVDRQAPWHGVNAGGVGGWCIERERAAVDVGAARVTVVGGEGQAADAALDQRHWPTAVVHDRGADGRRVGDGVVNGEEEVGSGARSASGHSSVLNRIGGGVHAAAEDAAAVYIERLGPQVEHDHRG